MNIRLLFSEKKCIACQSEEFVEFYNITTNILLPDNEAQNFNQSLECCYCCGLVRQQENETYADDKLNRYYQKTFRTPIHPPSLTKEDTRVNNAYKRLNFIQRIKSQGNLLEIGFGDGVFLNIASEYYNCTGLDPSIGYSNVRDFLQKMNIEVSDISIEKFTSENKFDIVCTFLVLEHIKDPLAFLSAQLKHLAPDGILIIEVPDIRRYISFNSETLLTHEHVYHYCLESLTFLLQKLNMELIDSSNENISYGFSQIAAFKIGKSVQAIHDHINGFVVLKMFQEFLQMRENYLLKMRYNLKDILDKAANQKQLIAIYGAGFLFNYAITQCGLDLNRITYLFDDTIDKIGTFYNGKEIISLTTNLDQKPDIVIIFSEMFFEPLQQKVIKTFDLENLSIINIHQLSI